MSTTLAELIASAESDVAAILGSIETARSRQNTIIATVRSDGRTELNPLETTEFDSLRSQIGTDEKRHADAKKHLDGLHQIAADEARNDATAANVTETAAAPVAEGQPQGAPAAGESRTRPAYDQVHRVASEERQYAAHKERGFDPNAGKFRGGAKPGSMFEFDVAAAFLGDYEAQDRLRQHQKEEKVERGEYLSRALSQQQSRAVGTGAFAGLTVPQYLTDMYAPAASPRRPFADICNHHDLPAQGMTVNISRITTPTAVGLQTTENTAVVNQDIDDTLLTVAVQTNAGQQTMSRQSIERGAGTEPVVMDDLYKRYHSNLDYVLINQATTGLSAIATPITYTDASPTVVEFAPLLSQASAGVEDAMLDLATGDNVALMGSRRWYWLNQAMSATWPLMSQPNTLAQTLGVNYGETYGRGLRGVLPNGLPVVVDANVPKNLGGGTNQDEVYVFDKSECHLWEDPDAPMFIRAEQPALASLGVLLVLYGYFAYTHSRLPNAQKITGTGLVTPTWTGA